MAAISHGSPLLTNDFDICYRRTKENAQRLVAALKELDARPRYFDPALPFILDATTLRNGDSFTFETTAGDVDCLGSPSGTTGYADLLGAAKVMDISENERALVCSLDDLIRMKRAAGRAKDLFALEHLIALKQVLNEKP
jgi:hypothetical protein